VRYGETVLPFLAGITRKGKKELVEERNKEKRGKKGISTQGMRE
jgi:hypothetical protein